MALLIYIICLGVGLVFTLASAIFGHIFGGGHEGHLDGSGGHAEAGVDASDMPGVSALSPTISLRSSRLADWGSFCPNLPRHERRSSARRCLCWGH
jgi:hypothetical protein